MRRPPPCDPADSAAEHHWLTTAISAARATPGAPQPLYEAIPAAEVARHRERLEAQGLVDCTELDPPPPGRLLNPLSDAAWHERPTNSAERARYDVFAIFYDLRPDHRPSMQMWERARNAIWALVQRAYEVTDQQYMWRRELERRLEYVTAALASAGQTATPTVILQGPAPAAAPPAEPPPVGTPGRRVVCLARAPEEPEIPNGG